MDNNFSYEYVNSLETALTEVLAKEYRSACAYVNVDAISLNYLACEPGDDPLITMHLRYGVAGDSQEWQKEVDLYISVLDPTFIAGQFYQILVSDE